MYQRVYVWYYIRTIYIHRDYPKIWLFYSVLCMILKSNKDIFPIMFLTVNTCFDILQHLRIKWLNSNRPKIHIFSFFKGTDLHGQTKSLSCH